MIELFLNINLIIHLIHDICEVANLIKMFYMLEWIGSSTINNLVFMFLLETLLLFKFLYIIFVHLVNCYIFFHMRDIYTQSATFLLFFLLLCICLAFCCQFYVLCWLLFFFVSLFLLLWSFLTFSYCGFLLLFRLSHNFL